MKRMNIIIITILIASLTTACVNEQSNDSHENDPEARQEPYIVEVLVNGQLYECDYSQELVKEKEQAEKLKALFEGKLNEYSFVSGHWLCLYDNHGTNIRSVRIGRDPFGFFPELPVMLFDNRGNLISLTSYDITEGYFVYSFCYDEQDRITYSQERSFTVAYKEGDAAGNPYDIDLQWEYADDGSYIVRMGSCIGRNNETEYVFDSIRWYDADGNEAQYKVFDSLTGEYVDWDTYWDANP